MTSNELNEILNRTRRTPKIELSAEQVEELIKQLEVLEILRKHLKVVKDWYNDDTMYRYILVLDFEDDDKEEMEVIDWIGECDDE